MTQRIFFALLAALGVVTASDKPDPSEAEIQQIIKTFAANESAFAKARANYTYRRSASLRETAAGGGRWEEVVDIVFTAEGRPQERVVNAPPQNLKFVIMTPQDLQDLRDVLPFVLTTEQIDQYHVRYLGRETVDEIETFVFAVKPKTREKNKRYFAGVVWVDDKDLQVVKSYGRGVGLERKHGSEDYAKFETFRQQVDGKYWFPTYTYANQPLFFESGEVPIRMAVKYENYKIFTAESTIKFGDVADAGAPGTPGAAGSAGGTGTVAAPEQPKGPELAPLINRPAKKKKK
jgi:hypothetical protein